MRNYDELLAEYPWRQIYNCPSCMRLSSKFSQKPPSDLASGDCTAIRLNSTECRDPIELIVLPGGGGLLYYVQPDGSYRHTLNTQEGPLRKLEQLGILEEVAALLDK